MAATKDLVGKYKEGVLLPFPVAAGAKIFHGTFVCADADGFAIPGADTAGIKFLGVAQGQVDNTGGADGAKKVLVRRVGVFEMAATSIAQTMVGDPMYLADDMTFDDAAGPTNDIKCGILVEYISATKGLIDIGR